MTNNNGWNKDEEQRRKKGEPKPHFLIPDSEVEEVDYDPTSRPQPLDIDHIKHGQYLSSGMKDIFTKHRSNATPISEEIVIFKVELRDGEKADARGDYEKIFLNNHLKVNAIRKSNVAIVSSTPSNLVQLEKKLNKYIDNNGRSSDFFQYVKSISTISVDEKKSPSLSSKNAEVKDFTDLQITLIPQLNNEVYSRMIDYLTKKINEMDGKLHGEAIYHLSDNTPVLRILLPSSGVNTLADHEIVLKIEPTPFFNTSRQNGKTQLNLDGVSVEYDSPLNEMPNVCILDDGIRLPEVLKDCIAGFWKSPDISSYSCEHGTKVASRAILGDNIDTQVINKILKPRVRVIDAVINDGGKLSEGILINRIRQAVENIKDVAKVFSLSFNCFDPIDLDTVSNLAYELDILMRQHNIIFVVPTGNHNLWTVYESLDQIIDDDASRLSSPGESFYGLTIGSITREEHSNSISRKNELSPFSRVGFGFSGNNKPDLVYPGGNVYVRNGQKFIASNSAAYVIDNTGHLVQDFGTSHSTPIAAADLSLLINALPDRHPLVAKSLLIHHAEETTKLNDNELYKRMYGQGIGNFENAKTSFSSRATYIRQGIMSRLKKQRVQFHMPTIMAEQSKRMHSVARVTVTCLCLPPINKTMGFEYLRGFIDTSFHYINSNDTFKTQNPSGKEGRMKWQNIHHFSQIFSVFNPGDWQIWLQLYTKPEVLNDEEVEYALIVTIENLTAADLDIHEGIELETGLRFQTLTEVQVDLQNDGTS